MTATETISLSAREYERLLLWQWRYETVRRMNAQQFVDAWTLNRSTGKPFDQIIDELRPFMFPGGAL